MHDEHREHKRWTVGLVVHRLEERTDWWTGASEAAQALDVNLLTLPAGLAWSMGMHGILHNLVSPDNVDGLVVAQWWPSFDSFAETYVRFYKSLPVVNIQRLYEGYLGVIAGNYRGTYALMRHLIEDHKYQHVVFLQGPEGNPSADERYQAYVDGLKAYDIPLDINLVIPGRFSEQSGVNAIHTLLDVRGLRPAVDFAAIVAAGDQIALGALTELQDRGIRVPEDVALVGFDDIEEAALVSPPLTTARMPNYEMGKKATEMLVQHLEGETFSPHVTIPAQVVIRESCGCVSATTSQVMADHATPLISSSGTFEACLLAHREQVATEMQQTFAVISSLLPSDWVEVLLEALRVDMEEVGANAFLGVFRDIVQRLYLAGVPDRVWHNLLSMLRRQVMPLVGTDVACLRRVENIWQQARVLIAEAAERASVRQRQDKVRSIERLHEVGASMLTTFELTEQMERLVQELQKLHIPGCYVALYTDPETPMEEARLILAYHEGECLPLPPEGIIFPTRQLLPVDILPPDQAYNLIAEPLYFQDRHLGYALLGIGAIQAGEYALLGRQIGTALQGALTAQAREQAERAIRRQAVQRQTAAEVSRVASSILAPDELMRQSVNLIRERFDLYYVGLFLVDEVDPLREEISETWAVLQAGTGEAGQAMLEAGHKLEVGGASMIGGCIQNKRARIALDVGDEAVRFDNPFLPATRSELALPLISRGNAIGALTIQSEQEAAFTEEDITVLQTMADQLANAIQNVRLLEQSRAALREMETMQRRYEQRAWADYVQSSGILDYEALRSGVSVEGPMPEILPSALQKGVQVVRSDEDEHASSALVAPITQRGGVVIGTLSIQDDEAREWTQEDIALLEAVVERMGMTAETLRLLEETQRGAARERAVSNVTAQVRESLELEDVLRAAAGQIREAMGLDKIVVRLAAPDEERVSD